jgi:hypothetical protein
MSKLDQQIQKLEQQRVKLDADLATLKHQRNEDILKVLDAFPDGNVCSKTIIGLLLEGLEVARKDAKKAEVWQQAGDTFCKRNGAKRSPQKTRSNLKKAA